MNTSTSLKQRTLKLALVAFACAAAVISGPSGAVPTNSASAAATGTVIAPITVSKTADLSFGKFAPGAASGTVTVSTAGDRTASGISLSSIGSAPTAAHFTVTGDAAATYAISHTGTALLTRVSGIETMALAKFSDLTGTDGTAVDATTGTLNGSGTQTIYVGGTLTVGANQVAGDYVGNIDVTVQYN